MVSREGTDTLILPLGPPAPRRHRTPLRHAARVAGHGRVGTELSAARLVRTARKPIAAAAFGWTAANRDCRRDSVLPFHSHIPAERRPSEARRQSET